MDDRRNRARASRDPGRARLRALPRTLSLCPPGVRAGVASGIRQGENGGEILQAGLEVLLIRRAFLLAPLLAFCAGCSALSGRCLYETRNVIAVGNFTEGATIIANAHMTVREQRDYQPDKNFMWQITGATLKGHVTRIILQDNAPSPKVYYDFPLDAAPQQLSGGYIVQSTGANINGFFDLLANNRAVIVISTDIPGRETISFPAPAADVSDWNRPYCS